MTKSVELTFQKEEKNIENFSFLKTEDILSENITVNYVLISSIQKKMSA